MRHIAYTAVVLAASATIAVASGQAAAQSPPNSAPVTFTRDVLPILQKNCQSCHRPGQIGPMPLLSYQQARPWARAIRQQVATRTMPPWHADPRYGHFVNDRSLKQSDIETLVAWADGGAVEGDPRDAPPPVTWAPDGWLVEPDLVVTLPDYQVPASGVIEWENLAVPSPFREDTWVTSIEILPSDPATVHHMCFEFQPHRPDVVHNRFEWVEVVRDARGVAVRPQPAERTVAMRDAATGEIQRRPGRPSIMAGGSHCYVPGMSLHDYRPLGAGQLVRGGVNMVFNLHFQTTGTPASNRVRIGFTVAKQPPRKKIVQLTPTGTGPGFAIPPNEPNYTPPPIHIRMKRDAELVWMSPHMHFRGKDMTWSLVHPDGRTQIVLSVPRYDYSWQLQYQTRVPVTAGTTLRVDAHYDNSAKNRFNPDPNTWVYAGNQAWEEMMVPFTWFVVDTDVDTSQLTERFTESDGA